MTEQIGEKINDLCVNYCKYPFTWDEEKEGVVLSESEICKNCPLNDLESHIEACEEKLSDIKILCKTEIAYISAHWLDYHYPSEARSGFETVLSHIQEGTECVSTSKQEKEKSLS